MTSSDDTALLEVRGLCKRFPGVRALHQVDLTLQRGQVLAVVGENGAGKSTLMKILAGIQAPDHGKIRMDGSPVEMRSVSDALGQGVALIHQELNLSDNLSISANVFLGHEPHRMGWTNHGKAYRETKKYLQMVGLDADPDTLVHDLTIGRQQLVEIAKALSINARILIMDEPTSSLSQKETETLFQVVDDLRDNGVSVIYISHRLREIIRLADHVTVLRDGENAGELAAGQIDHSSMVSLMVGRDISQFYARSQHELGEVALEVRDLVVPDHPQHKLSFQIRAGEIVGVAGLVGAGRTEMLRCLFGVEPGMSGEVLIDGKNVTPKSPATAIQASLALVPEDRKQQGLVVDWTIRENISLAGLQRNSRFGSLINMTIEHEDAMEMIDRLRVKTPSADQVTRFLSGGNQQKVVLGKWLSLGPKVLLLDEPTRGIDIGAKEEIYRLMEQLAADGVAILFVSSEIDEIVGMSDRTIVMHEGQLTGELSREELTEEAIMNLATGSVAHS